MTIVDVLETLKSGTPLELEARHELEPERYGLEVLAGEFVSVDAESVVIERRVRYVVPLGDIAGITLLQLEPAGVV